MLGEKPGLDNPLTSVNIALKAMLILLSLEVCTGTSCRNHEGNKITDPSLAFNMAPFVLLRVLTEGMGIKTLFCSLGSLK